MTQPSIRARTRELAADPEASLEAIVVKVQAEYRHLCCARSYILRIAKACRAELKYEKERAR